MLFEYTVKLLLVAGFLELVLYRLISRLGMHLSKVAEKHESVRLTFKALSSIGFTLLNFVSLLLFLAFFLLLFNKLRAVGVGRYDGLLIPSVSLLLVLTVAFLVFPPAMLGSVVYNVVTLPAVQQAPGRRSRTVRRAAHSVRVPPVGPDRGVSGVSSRDARVGGV